MKKRNFRTEFRHESAQLVVDQNYTVADAAKAMNAGLSDMIRWVKQLRDERAGKKVLFHLFTLIASGFDTLQYRVNWHA